MSQAPLPITTSVKPSGTAGTGTAFTVTAPASVAVDLGEDGKDVDVAINPMKRKSTLLEIQNNQYQKKITVAMSFHIFPNGDKYEGEYTRTGKGMLRQGIEYSYALFF